MVNGKTYAIEGASKVNFGSAVSVSTVEEYDTGFMPPQALASIDAKEKLVTLWGRIRSD